MLGTIMGFIGVIVGIIVFLLEVAVVARALTRPHRTAASRVAWVAVIMFLPVLGIIAYLFLGETNIGPTRVRALNDAEAHIQRSDDRAAAPENHDADAATRFNMTASINQMPPTSGNSLRIAADSDASIAELVADIDAATESVHLSFYIWLNDNNGGKVADAVSRAAQRGVTCRIMVDALGSRAFIASPRWAQMRDAGAHVVSALDDIPRVGNLAVGRLDLRNHRKIVVIDDHIAFLGSQNCADAAFRVKPKFAPWVDVFFRCEGPIVRQQQWLFLTVWSAESGETIAADAVSSIPLGPARGTAVAAIFGTGPTARAGAMSDAFITVIAGARETLTISTPYFVPDSALLQAICAAPRRGVRTILVLPARNDSWFVAEASRSTYEVMLDAGVELYEYPLGLLHSKTITVDGTTALVGSANMDRRSLELNYENNVLVDDAALTASVRKRQQVYLDASQRVDPAAVAQWSFGKRLVQNAVGMLGPLL